MCLIGRPAGSPESTRLLFTRTRLFCLACSSLKQGSGPVPESGTFGSDWLLHLGAAWFPNAGRTGASGRGPGRRKARPSCSCGRVVLDHDARSNELAQLARDVLRVAPDGLSDAAAVQGRALPAVLAQGLLPLVPPAVRVDLAGHDAACAPGLRQDVEHDLELRSVGEAGPVQRTQLAVCDLGEALEPGRVRRTRHTFTTPRGRGARGTRGGWWRRPGGQQDWADRQPPGHHLRRGSPRRLLPSRHGALPGGGLQRVDEREHIGALIQHATLAAARAEGTPAVPPG